MKERDFTAYCGLYCGDCIRYQSRTSELAEELLEEIKKTKFTEYANVKKSHKKEFENFNIFLPLLKVISEIKCIRPCRLGGDGCENECEIIKCVRSQKFEGCWDCNDFENCEKLIFLKPFHGNGPVKNLKKIKEFGLENWAKDRVKCYPWL